MQYGMSDVDEHGAVKPGVGLYIISFFLCRQFFYAPISMLASRRGRGQRSGSGNDLDLSFLLVTSFWEFLACIPGAFMLFLLVKKKQEVGDLIRKLWSNGRNLLLLGVASQIAAQLLHYVANDAEPSMVGLALGVGYLYCIIYLLTNTRVKDVFSRVPV